MRNPIQTPRAPKPIGPYSPGIIDVDFVFVSGQGSIDPATGTLQRGDVRSETRRVFENIKAILEAGGSSLAKVVKCNVYCTPDPSHFGRFNAVYERYFPTEQPARIFLHVPSWPGPFDVEVDCIAVL